MKYIVTLGDSSHEIDINVEGEVVADGRRMAVDFQSVADQPVYSLIINGKSYEASVFATEARVDVLLQGKLYQVTVEEERQKRLRETSSVAVTPEGEYVLKAPMPGLVVSVPVVEGQPVQRGDNLVILESMKMQNELKAPREGTVERIRIRAGDSVDQNQSLLSLA
jgi:acetyl/propionyl-CoA carboxylase alpha subunit